MAQEFGLLELIKSDLARLGCSGGFAFLKWYFFPRGETFPYVVWLRILHVCRKRVFLRWTIGIILYPIYRHFEFKYGIHANPNIEIGPGLRVIHGPCNLNAARIGRNFTVYSGVTIGVLRNGIPVIGDDVTIYTNAVVVGAITIGDNATIGALTYVAKDIPPGIKVFGVMPLAETSKMKTR